MAQLNENFVSYRQIAEILDNEIAWCKDHPLESGKGHLWENGFAAGLEQAKTLIEKVRIFIGVDEAHGNDEGMKVEGYWFGGVYTITKVSRLTQRAADFADCHVCGIAYPSTATVCTKCGGKLQSR